MGDRGRNGGRRKPRGASWLLLALLFTGDVLEGQDVFQLSIQGLPNISALPGVVTEEYHVFLSHTGSGFGAQAWSYGVWAPGASISSATTAGTAADVIDRGGFRLHGFEKTEMVDPSKNGNTSGAVSAVVLSLTAPVRLPSNSSQKVGVLDVDFEVQEGLTYAVELRFLDYLRGSGLPVKIAVTQEGETQDPFLRSRDVTVRGVFDCCDAPLNAGFSVEAIRDRPLFDGIVGTGPYCLAEEGVLFHAANAGPLKVFVNIVSNLDDPEGVQGWSLSVLLEGDGDVLSATTAGTAADREENGGLWSSGFNKTEYSDLRLGGQQQSTSRGAISGIVLSLTEGTTLPPRGTESVLVLEVTGPESGTSVVSLRDGLRGSGQPVMNVFTVGGDSRFACNRGTARLAIQHGRADFHLFIRGNANDDLGIDIADPIWIVNELYLDGPATACPDDADANDDGLLDASDVVYLIEYLFRAGVSPPAPFPECGADPTEDEVDCFGPSLECG